MLYAFGILCFLVLFLVEKITGVISKLINLMTNCATKGTLVTHEFSSNLLKELNFDDLQMEYSQTLQHLAKAMHSKTDEGLQHSKDLY